MGWFRKSGSIGREAENLLICWMRSAGSRAGNTSCDSLKLQLLRGQGPNHPSLLCFEICELEKQTDTLLPAEFTLSVKALIRKQVCRREEDGDPQGSPNLHIKILQQDVTSKCGWRAPQYKPYSFIVHGSKCPQDVSL